MKNINSVVLTGRLDRDVMIRNNTDGSHNIMFTLVPGKLPVKVFVKKENILPTHLASLKKDDTVLVQGKFAEEFWTNGKKLEDGGDAYSESYYVNAAPDYVIPMSPIQVRAMTQENTAEMNGASDPVTVNDDGIVEDIMLNYNPSF